MPTGAPSRRTPASIGAVAGLLSGLLGVGGGIVMVPAFTQWAGMPVKRAIGTSLACVALFAVSGSITHGLAGNIDWRFALLLAVGVIPGARIGAALTIAADDRTLRRVVAGFLGVTAVLYARRRARRDALSPPQDGVEHRLGELAGEGVLLAHVVAAQQRAAVG